MQGQGLKGVPRKYGRYIYAYCHVRTKQVVYSFTHVLDNYRVLKQLPDLGANNKDAVLRKDMWKPLYTLCLPEGDDARSQGLAAFKKLREWRKLHELSWEMPESLKMPYTEEHMDDKFKRRLEERGGNKKEHPHDLAKKAKKRARVRLVQNQKENAIADLAAVLLEQEDMGQYIAEWKADTTAADRAKEVQEMRDLAEQAKKGGIEKLEAEIRGIERRLEKVLAGEEDVEGFKRTRLRREIQSLELKQVRMEFAFRAVTKAEREIQGLKAQPLAHSTQAKAAHQFAELARTNLAVETANTEAILAELEAQISQPANSTDAEESMQALERTRLHHQARLHRLQLAHETSRWTFDGNWLAAVDDLQQKLLDYKVRLAEGVQSLGNLSEQTKQEFMARAQAEAAQWRALRAQPDFVVQSNLYEGSKAARAQELRYLAEIADKGALRRIEDRIEARRNQLESGAGPETEVMHGLLNALRITERYMQLAATAAAKNPATDMMAEADDIRTSVLEFAVRRAKENILNAQKARKSKDFIQDLERDLAETQKVLQEIRDSGATTAERNAAERRQRLADEGQAERASRPELFASEPEPIEETRASTEQNEAPEQLTPGQSAEEQEVSAASSEQSASVHESAAAPVEIDWASKLPSFPERTKEPVPKRSKEQEKQRKLNAPIFSTEGVMVKWHNILDAEFAERWPSNVQHERMGWTRFTAPRGLAPPVDDLAEHTVTGGRRSKQYALSAPLPGTAAAEDEPVSQIEEGEMGAEGEEALKAEAEQRDAIVDVAKSQILHKVRELARQESFSEAKRQRYSKYVARAERRGETVKSMEEFYSQASQKASELEPVREGSQSDGDSAQV